MSDQIFIENGLSIVENPKLIQGNYGTWLKEKGMKKSLSHREKMCQVIDEILLDKSSKSIDFDEFLKRLGDYGYSISKRGKNIRFQSPEKKIPIRFSSLKDDYTEVTIRERINGKRIIKTQNRTEGNTKLS